MKIIPYLGTESIRFTMTYAEVISYLKKNHIRFNTEHWSNRGCTPEVAWDIIRIGDYISIFFAKGVMFKMYFENSYSGSLNNGISLGMNIDDALKIDSSLQFDDWEADYASDNGYWLETDALTGDIISITVFIKEVEDDEVFYSYRWCEK